ncbi:MAG: 4Fe-4S binding protein [Bacteroidetes bacterium]|nr:4Fe-4S binding protein [Bacteroidota bacterium]
MLAYLVIRPLLDKNYGADFEAYCPFGGMQALASFFSSNTLTCSMTTVQIATGLAVLFGVIVVSKLFCSYICPIGTVTEWIGEQARKMKMQVTLSGKPDRFIRILKYSLLFITFYYSVSSSELFCRKFDPYYASFTGFSGDVVWYFALPALILTMVGSFFIRQFWCKYLCPLGAITNLAAYALPSVSLALIWVLANSIFPGTISWIWLAACICLLGFLLEATTLKFLIFPPLRITRNSGICTSCRICDKKCPMSIPISTVDKVNHIDCHLCVECVVKCPEKAALTINNKQWNWLPSAASVILIASALIISSAYELPTISERWVETSRIKEAGVFEMSGLKNIKCFGSSRSFANQMKEVPGVLGVETYVKHHKVRVYFDTKLTGSEKIKEAIFSPYSEFLNSPAAGLTTIKTFSVGIDHCFDPNDQSLLAELFRDQKGVMSLETTFGEPIQATFYYDPGLISSEKIKSRIEQKSVELKGEEGTFTVEPGFAINSKGQSEGTMEKAAFLERYFESRDVKFNKFDSYSASSVKTLNLPFPSAMDPEMQDWIPYLVSQLSNDDGVIRFKIEFTSSDPLLLISYVPTMTTRDKIIKLMNEPTFMVHYPDKSVKKVKNPFPIVLSGSGKESK